MLLVFLWDGSFDEFFRFIFQQEAMRAFVQPETLEGRDQYFCEKCNKKCDAHKVEDT